VRQNRIDCDISQWQAKVLDGALFFKEVGDTPGREWRRDVYNISYMLSAQRLAIACDVLVADEYVRMLDQGRHRLDEYAGKHRNAHTQILLRIVAKEEWCCAHLGARAPFPIL
jgi:hypothetical protein